LEAELLLAKIVGQSRAWLYARLDESPEPSVGVDFDELLARRSAGEPMAYILGEREFYGRDFRVDPSVLIPRPETELLVDLALELRGMGPTLAADIGTGSGCIALTLAAERPNWMVTATDLSLAALRTAEYNRRALGVPNVHFAHGDLAAALEDTPFDLIVSNPPYVAEHDSHLSRGDLQFEPSVALSCAEQGLEIIRRLTAEAVGHLRVDGWLVLEHGHDQAISVAALLKDRGFSDVNTHRDLGGIERVTLGRWPGC
jgi:release factor glutamine methyltransferase